MGRRSTTIYSCKRDMRGNEIIKNDADTTTFVSINAMAYVYTGAAYASVCGCWCVFSLKWLHMYK